MGTEEEERRRARRPPRGLGVVGEDEMEERGQEKGNSTSQKETKEGHSMEDRAEGTIWNDRWKE